MWISVKDRLPEPKTDVLIFLKEDDFEKIITGYYYTSTSYGNTEIMWMDNYYLIGAEVTHWMPLPAPPEHNDIK